MKMKYLFLACGMAALFAACQNENEPKVVSDKPGTSGDYRIIIEGEETDAQTSRSSGTIQFVGGTASGAGLYDGTAKAIVSATPDPGYEINYFYGGPDSQPKKYDYANGGASTFDVSIEGQDYLFHVGFKKKTGSLTINAGTGGKVSPSGQQEIQREVPFSIKAIPDNGYEFAGWTVNNGSVTIENANSTSTTATLNSASGTITANFRQSIMDISITQTRYLNNGWSSSETEVEFNVSSGVTLDIQYTIRVDEKRDNGQTSSSTNYLNVKENQRVLTDSSYDDGYGNYRNQVSTITKFIIKKDGKIIYNSNEPPLNGNVYNGYKVTYITKTVNV